MSQRPCVQPLKKVKVRLQAGATDAVMDIPLPSPEIDFIFGIGSGGLTPFECLLSDRRVTESFSGHVAGAEASLFFGHVAPALGRLFETRETVFFNACIVAVETPPPREVIKAMADVAAHGHAVGCDCGCGCS